MSQTHNKLHVNFHIPGKTFLLGEYVAVAGGPSLVATTGPNFVVSFTSGTGQHPFHPNSPAGRWISRYKDFFSKMDVAFNDPYQTGGFGASTAQFIAVCGFQKKYNEIISHKPFNFKNPQLALEIWNDYRSLFADQKNPPSGADLMAQILGGITSFSPRQKNWIKLEWPFAHPSPSFYKTAFKVNTHEHLEQLDMNSPMIQELEACVQQALQAIESEDFLAYKQACLAFSQIQSQSQLLTIDVKQLIAELDLKNLDFARGCGALGADVIAVYSDKVVAADALRKVASLTENMAYGTWMEVH